VRGRRGADPLLARRVDLDRSFAVLADQVVVVPARLAGAEQLVGIVSQRDVALAAQPEAVGETVEAISL